jgi:sugar lactone lactonase YvrE
VDQQGTIFVADTGNNRIRKISADNPRQVFSIAGSGLPGYLDGVGASAQFNFPNDLVMDQTGNLYVTEFNNHTIRKITPNGAVSTFVGNGRPGFADGPREVAQLSQPAGIAIDKQGNIYVTEWGGHRIRKINSAGVVTTLAGSIFPGLKDGPGAQASFFRPDGIVADVTGVLYVAEHGNHAIRRIAPDGAVTTVAGNTLPGHLDGLAEVARFNAPGGIGIAADGTLIVADTGNNRIRVISAISAPEILAAPENQTVPVGSAVEFRVVASGGGQLKYSWKFGGATIPGEVTPVLRLSNVRFDQAGHYSVAVSNLAGSTESMAATLTVIDPITFARSLPVYYAPEVKLTVRLESAGLAGFERYAYALEDSPPPNWSVGAVSEGGSYDPSSGKVKFGPFFDLAPRSLAYEITPPRGESGTGHFKGVISANGHQSGISGASSILPPPLHPADSSPADWRISIAETTAYGGAWLKGLSWKAGPNPIPVDYVTRAGMLWKRGEAYRFDPDSDSPPLWWINQVLVAPTNLREPSEGTLELAGDRSARRLLPASFAPGETLEVRLAIDPPASSSVYAVEERVPVGWEVIRISDAGAHDNENRLVRWGPFFDNNKRELSFEVMVPGKAQATATLGGVISLDGQSWPIAGPELIRAAVRLRMLSRLGADEFGLSVGSADGKTYLIETSSDLQTWSPLGMAQNSDALLRFKDVQAMEMPHRFYRAVCQDP